MTRTSNPQGFFFVNKSEKSSHLSKSLFDEKVAIQRHVQTGRKRSRLPRRPKYDTRAPLASGVRSDSSPAAPTVQNSQFRNDAHEQNSPCSCSTDPSGFITDICRCKGNYSFVDKLSCDASLRSQKLLSKRDPFDAASVPISKSVAGLLHYYMYYYHPSQWPNEMALLRQGVYTFRSAVQDILRSAITDRLVMYCLLGAAACRLQFVDRLPCSLVIGSEHFYIHKAVKLMATAVENSNMQDSDQLYRLLICISFLGSAEAYRDDLSAARLHLDATVRLLEPAGGLRSVERDILRGQIAMADLFLACVDVRPCLFDCLYDPGSASSLRLLDRELLDSFPSSTALSLLGRQEPFLPLEMRSLVEELVESHSVKSRILVGSMSDSRAMQVTHWITMRNMAIRNKLLAFKTTDLRIHTLRTAIIMWTLFAMNVTGRAKTVKLMAPKLKSSLSKIPLSDWAGTEDVKLWIMMIGFYCASDGSEESTWFTDVLRGIMHEVFTTQHPDTVISIEPELLEDFQRNFFFEASVQRTRTKALAEKLKCFDPKHATIP